MQPVGRGLRTRRSPCTRVVPLPAHRGSAHGGQAFAPYLFAQASSSATFRSSRPRAFTLIELLIVVAIIAVLAGLTLAAMGGLNQRAARDRAKGEVAAIVNAIESHRTQTGTYPANILYATLSGFLGSARFDTNSSGQIIDPYWSAYLYRTSGTGLKNLASFDVYSLGANTANTAAGAADDIGNW